MEDILAVAGRCRLPAANRLAEFEERRFGDARMARAGTVLRVGAGDPRLQGRSGPSTQGGASRARPTRGLADRHFLSHLRRDLRAASGENRIGFTRGSGETVQSSECSGAVFFAGAARGTAARPLDRGCFACRGRRRRGLEGQGRRGQCVRETRPLCRGS